MGGGAGAVAALLAWDAALLLLLLLDGRLAPPASAFRVERRLREPLTAFVANPVSLRLQARSARPLRMVLADAPPASFDSIGHRARLELAGGGGATGWGAEGLVAYAVTPRSRGRHAFGDLALRVLGPLGLAWRPLRLPLGREVSVYPELGGAAPGLAEVTVPAPGRAGRAAPPGRGEGREFAALRHYLPGDDLRSMDWKATARRGWPVVREWQPERNQTVWVLLDCGRSQAARLGSGRNRLDRSVEAALALARAAAERGDRTGAILFAAEVERVVPVTSGRTRLGPLAEALHLAEPQPVEADYGAAFDELMGRQRRRALVVLFTELSDPATIALLLARAEVLRRRHLVAVASVADPELDEAASARPERQADAFARAAAGRIADEREVAVRRLAAAGVAVIHASAANLAASVVARYGALKQRGQL
jgi:uncharacterized protein (DUF58 family)